MKTLKILILSGLMLLPGLGLLAQSINYGIQAGYVYAIAHATRDCYIATRLFYPMHSFNINGTIEYRFHGAWGIAAEPGFIRKGSVVDGDNHHLYRRFNLHLNYLQLPILANFYWTDRFFISIGPELAYLINKDGNVPSLSDDYTPYQKEVYIIFTPFEENAFEISGLIGVNYSITKKIDLSFRYNHSFTYFAETPWFNHRYPPEEGPMGYSKDYNQYLQFIIRYKIKTGADK